MYVTSTEQTSSSHQTQNLNVKTTSSDEFFNALQTFESKKSEETGIITDENLSKEYKEGAKRLFFLTNNGEYFKDTVFENNSELQNSFIEYLGDLSIHDYMVLNVNFISSFANSLMQDKNGNVVAQGPSDKNFKDEFKSVNSAINYFQNQIDNLEELNPRPTQMINILSDTMNLFKTYQVEDNSKEEKKTEKTEEKKEVDLWALFEDIKSLMKRGVTTEEIEMLENFMKQIFKKLENDPLTQDDIKDINKLLKKLENMILELKKRISGAAIKDADGSQEAGVSKDSLSFNLSSGETLKIENIGTKVGSSLINRINDAIDAIKDIKEAKGKLEKASSNTSSKEELELLNQLKNFMK